MWGCTGRIDDFTVNRFSDHQLCDFLTINWITLASEREAITKAIVERDIRCIGSVAYKNDPDEGADEEPPEDEPQPAKGGAGSGFFVSRQGHIITNEHVVRGCSTVAVGDNVHVLFEADVLETDARNDLALLRVSNEQFASTAANVGEMRSDDIELGESVLVAGFPYREIFSNTLKVTGGIVSAVRGLEDDTGRFQLDAAIQPGNSGGPIYDENGNIIGVVVERLNKWYVVQATGSLPENVNFGIKASTVRQFVAYAGLTIKWSRRTERRSTKELAQIAKSQTVMVFCYP